MTETPSAPLVPLREDPLGQRMTLLCPAWVHCGDSFVDFLLACDAVETLQPGTRALASFDDLGQALYTSYHAVLSHDLDSPDGHDLSGLPSAAFEDGAHIGQFLHPEEFPLRLANLRRARRDAAGRSVGKLAWTCPNTGLSLDAANADPAALRDTASVIQAVPVKAAAGALAAFPNGYFSGDWSPPVAHGVAQMLEPMGAALQGVGASYLMFRLSGTHDTEALLRAVAPLYADPDLPALRRALAGQDTLLLRYTD
ncbi:hypothetical protein [Jannaschia marina]|uniref:hypothetical protein n=1 Tax=Jannaschia marina TaxID=2741674 RepID=UPI0015C6B2B0|nr:hypothetical protein [Jannaschia marina]